MIAPDPALRLLVRRKLAGTFRKQVRRVKTPGGAALALLGLAVMGLWLSSLVFGLGRKVSGESSDGWIGVDAAQVSLFFLFAFTSLASIGHRGLFVPKEEIELLFAAPLSRADVIRYRLLTNVGRSLFGAAIVGLLTMRRAPNPWFGFAGTFLAVQALPLVGQGVALLLGGAELRAQSKAPKRIARVAGFFAFFLYLGIVALLVTNANEKLERWMQESAAGRGFSSVFTNPWVLAVSSVCRPFARAITASEPADFALWAAACVGIWIALLELVARIPVDYRELSLQTSSDVAKRIQRMRRGGGAATVSSRAAGWRVPWLFGRGRAGALAWLKLASVVRKARATVVVSVAILALVTFFSAAVLRGERGPRAEPAASILVAVFGCMYLCGTLRFDFREDLERMEFLKTCPVPAWRLFLGTIAPQVSLVSALVSLALLVKCAIAGIFPAELPWIFLGIPLLAYTWVAIDNIVFLAAPVRGVAGQDTVLQNAGRAVVTMFLRLGVLVAVAATVGLPVSLGLLAQTFFPDLGRPLLGIGIAAGVAAWIVDGALLTLAGAWQLRRFDVARDRG